MQPKGEPMVVGPAMRVLPISWPPFSLKVKKVEPPVAITYWKLASAVTVSWSVRLYSDWKRRLPVSDGLMRGRHQKEQVVWVLSAAPATGVARGQSRRKSRSQ